MSRYCLSYVLLSSSVLVIQAYDADYYFLQNLATHLAGTTYAIAEQAADIIKVAHGYHISQ